MKASKLYRKCPKTPDFDHSNYRLFEMIPAVPGTLNNRGLTVFILSLRMNSIFITSKPGPLFVLRTKKDVHRPKPRHSLPGSATTEDSQEIFSSTKTIRQAIYDEWRREKMKEKKIQDAEKKKKEEEEAKKKEKVCY